MCVLDYKTGSEVTKKKKILIKLVVENTPETLL